MKFLDQLNKWEPAEGGVAERVITVGYFATFLISVIALYLTTNYSAQEFLFNADYLWMEDYLRDWLIYGVDMRTWMTPGAINYFPEMLIYGLFRFSTATVYWGFIGFGFTKIFIYLFLIYGLLAFVSGISQVQRVWFSILVISIMLTAIIFLGNQYNGDKLLDFWQLFIPTAHGGAIINALVALYLLLRWIQVPEIRSPFLFLLFLLSIIASLSDMLFVVWFVLPALGAAVVLFGLRRISWRTATCLSGVLLVSEEVGRNLFAWIFPIQQVSYQLSFFKGLQSTLNFYKVIFAEGWYHPFVVFSYFCLAVIAFRVLFLAWKTRSRQIPGQVFDPQDMTQLFILPFAVLVLPSSFLAMSLINRPETQYFTGGNLVALALWVFLLVMSPPGLKLLGKGWLHTGMIMILVGYISFVALSFPAPIASLLTIPNPYSELVACLDSHAVDFYGGSGIADYWQARRINLFSQKGIHVDQVIGENLELWQWAGNQEMLEKRKHTFVLTDTPTNLPKFVEADVIRLQGKPDARFICAGFPVLVYQNGMDVKLTPNNLVPLPVTIIDAHQTFITEIFDPLILGKQQTQMFTLNGAWRANGLYSSGNAGVLLYGPYTTLSSGTYRVEWLGKIVSGSPEEIGTVDVASNTGANVLFQNPVTQKSIAALPNGQLAALEFSLDHKTSLMQFRFIVNEKAMVVVNEIIITRIGNK